VQVSNWPERHRLRHNGVEKGKGKKKKKKGDIGQLSQGDKGLSQVNELSK
jgi:hypothetical protein